MNTTQIVFFDVLLSAFLCRRTPLPEAAGLKWRALAGAAAAPAAGQPAAARRRAEPLRLHRDSR